MSSADRQASPERSRSLRPADPGRKNLDERRQAMIMFAADLAGTGQIQPDHSVETAADVLWLAMDVPNYDWLVRQRGWPVDRFRDRYVDTVAAAILIPQ
jgi:hypothetical protein